MCSRLSQCGVLCLGSALPAICIQVSFVRTRARFKQRRLGPLVRMCGRVPPRVGHFKDYLCREDAEIARNCCERRTFISVCAICVCQSTQLRDAWNVLVSIPAKSHFRPPASTHRENCAGGWPGCRHYSFGASFQSVSHTRTLICTCSGG